MSHAEWSANRLVALEDERRWQAYDEARLPQNEITEEEVFRWQAAEEVRAFEESLEVWV